MKASEFFDGVLQYQVPWQDRLVGVPTFYQDVRMLTALFMAPLAGVRALLPSRRLHPVRVTPWHAVVHIAAWEYRECDIGPYNEVAISIPVSVDRPSPVFTGLLLPAPAEPDAYVTHLPVTTEIACTLGIEAAAYPKFLAGIEFGEQGDRVSCRLSEAGRHILTLTVRKGQLRPVPRSRTHPINSRAGRLLRTLVIFSERDQATSRKPGDAKLELGNHPISQELRDLHLGRMVQCEYTPGMQAILAPVLESFSA